ncbi:MAG: hypothetical protein IKN54_06195 [Lachnospiraceae bacterium]|nr:hypothetical protein [Lachnospiraceae bacterium]
MKRLDGQDIMQTQDGEFHGANNAVEINAYHNKGVSEAEDWANSIRRIMTSPRYGINMACKYHNQVDNAADASIIRFVMRFESKTTEEEQ